MHTISEHIVPSEVYTTARLINSRAPMPQFDPENLISFTDAAREKDCGRNTLYRAADRGDINTVEVSGTKMIVKDESFATFEPEWTGARAQQDQDSDNN